MILKEPIVILANGAFPESKVSFTILKKAKNIVCLDGATNNLIKHGLEPTLIIGDLDSIESKYKTMYKDIIIDKKLKQTKKRTNKKNHAKQNKI